MTERHLGHDRGTWGDDPEERDASAVYDEFRGDAKVQEEWRDRVPLAPLKVVWGFIKRNGRRVGVTIAGFAVLLAGVVMLVLPGPGIAAIIAGLAILSTEYVWAQRMLHLAKRKAEDAKNAVLRKKGSEAADPAVRDDPTA